MIILGRVEFFVGPKIKSIFLLRSVHYNFCKTLIKQNEVIILKKYILYNDVVEESIVIPDKS